jgi:NitT/TauT family transport system ATP-binding protein
VTAAPPAGAAHIAVEGVRKAFASPQGDVVALDGIDLRVAPGEFVSILGPSGCGKSTLLMIVAGLVPPSAGVVTVAGRRVTAPVTDLGIVFQQDLLLDWRTVLGNVMLQADVRRLDRDAARARARELLRRVGLAEFEARRPWELSGGMRQRVAICRALLHDASLLLLDEPFGALDAITRDQMNADLQSLWWGDRRTAVLVTHSIGEAIFLSDRILVMTARPGRVALEATVALPRPRTRDVQETPEFARLHRQLREAIEGGRTGVGAP